MCSKPTHAIFWTWFLRLTNRLDLWSLTICFQLGPTQQTLSWALNFCLSCSFYFMSEIFLSPSLYMSPSKIITNLSCVPQLPSPLSRCISKGEATEPRTLKPSSFCHSTSQKSKREREQSRNLAAVFSWCHLTVWNPMCQALWTRLVGVGWPDSLVTRDILYSMSQGDYL